jgi:hypothetical protein
VCLLRAKITAPLASITQWRVPGTLWENLSRNCAGSAALRTAKSAQRLWVTSIADVGRLRPAYAPASP